jgi:hypothetical protein
LRPFQPQFVTIWAAIIQQAPEKLAFLRYLKTFSGAIELWLPPPAARTLQKASFPGTH